MNSRASRRVRAGAVVDAVNAVIDHLSPSIIPQYVARAAKDKLAEVAPHVPWVVTSRGRLDVCEASGAVSAWDDVPAKVTLDD